MFGFYASFSIAEELAKPEKALKAIFSEAESCDFKKITLTGEQIADIERKADINFSGAHSQEIIFCAVQKQGEIVGYAFEDTVIGKWGPIHYLLGVSTEGKVKGVVVLDYKEIRGRPVAKKRFLGQYKGKDINDPLKLREDIDGITGATISSRSLTDGVRKLLNVYEQIKPLG